MSGSVIQSPSRLSRPNSNKSQRYRVAVLVLCLVQSRRWQAPAGGSYIVPLTVSFIYKERAPLTGGSQAF